MSTNNRFQKYRFDAKIIEQVRSLYDVDNYHGVFALGLDYAVIAACIVACELIGWVAYPFAVLLIGSRQRALATMTHEASHRVLARNRRLNDLLGSYFSGYLVGMLFHAYRLSHVQSHHGHFGDRENDADYRYMQEMGVYERCSQTRYTWNILIKPLLLLRLPSYLGYLVRDRLLAARSIEGRRELFRLAVFWAVLLSALISFGFAGEFLLYWVVPFLTSFQILGWYIELSEHAPLMEARLDIHMSRNRNSHWLERFLTGMHGENYHLAHHLWPRVPFWKMQKLNEILRQDLVYRAHDDGCGGILFSNNGAPSVITVMSTMQSRLREIPGGQPAGFEPV